MEYKIAQTSSICIIHKSLTVQQINFQEMKFIKIKFSAVDLFNGYSNLKCYFK